MIDLRPCTGAQSLFWSTLLAILTIISSASAQNYDFGDAPDDLAACGIWAGGGMGRFPSLENTSNAALGRAAPRHLLSSNISLGGAPSGEADAFQPTCDWLTPPYDEDDGPMVLHLGAGSGIAVNPPYANGVYGPFPGTTTQGIWVFDVTMDARAPNVPYYANVAVDWNRSGKFGDAPGEWAMQDHLVPYEPGQSQTLITTPFPVTGLGTTPRGWMITPFWTRFHVSRERKLPAFPGKNWDGSGTGSPYIDGETEDWVVTGDPGRMGTICRDRSYRLITDLFHYGRGTPGCARGPHQICVNSSPAIGNRQFQITSSNPPRSGYPSYMGGVAALSTGMDARGSLLMGGFGPRFHVDWGRAFGFLLMRRPTSPEHPAYTALPIPYNRSLRGLRLYTQIFWMDRSCKNNPWGMSSTGGLGFSIK